MRVYACQSLSVVKPRDTSIITDAREHPTLSFRRQTSFMILQGPRKMQRDTYKESGYLKSWARQNQVFVDFAPMTGGFLNYPPVKLVKPPPRNFFRLRRAFPPS